ncbi:hypothetical protein [Dyella sp. C11]|uniref:hypothetical protein n=1 Tax=Dyella sp. C11 TaxID=2126991 RepID=UPI000D64372A|nr:hypothetical protein [Dyella sp. C11]
MRNVFLLMAAAALLASCSDRPLRGAADPSPDGKTYLAIMDDNGGACGPIKVDGQVWTHKIGEPAAIEPGKHSIECGTGMTFDIPSGTVFKFDYWGP